MFKSNAWQQYFTVALVSLLALTLVACTPVSKLSTDQLLAIDLKQALIPADNLPASLTETTSGIICTNQTNRVSEPDSFECVSFRPVAPNCPCPSTDPWVETIPGLRPQPLRRLYGHIGGISGITGGLNIYLYESKQRAEDAYEHELGNVSSKFGRISLPVSDIGDTARLIQNGDTMLSSPIGLEMTDLVFTRCGTFVTIRLTHKPEQDVKDTILTYSKELDERLKKLVCQ